MLGTEKPLTLEYIPQLRMSSLTKNAAARTLLSGELSRLTGVSRDALRHYERNGLLPAAQRSENGYRRYPPQALVRVRLIRGALSIGFTVEELREILQARDRGLAPCREVHALAIVKARDLQGRIRELEALHRALQAAIRSWAKRLKSAVPGKRAGLLEMFVANHPESVTAVSPLMSPGLRRKFQRNEDKRK